MSLRFSWMALVGLLPLLAVGMLALGTYMAAVPFEHVVSVGYCLAFGAALLLVYSLQQLSQRSWKAVVPYLLLVIGLAQGAAALWIIREPRAASAELVGAHPERMGELLAGYVHTFGDGARARELAERLGNEAPYPQIFAFHLAHPGFSADAGVPDLCVTRLSREGPDVVLTCLEGAVQAFGSIDGQLGPMAAALDMNADQLDIPTLAAQMPDLYELASPTGPFTQLSAALTQAAAAEAERLDPTLKEGDLAFAQLAVAAAADGDPRVHLDERGAPAGLHRMDHLLPRWYLAPSDAANKVVRVRYRELRAGEIVETNRGPKPVDIVRAEFSVQVEIAGEVRYDHTFRGESPLDAWKILPADTPLRSGYRDTAVDALSRDLSAHFRDVIVD